MSLKPFLEWKAELEASLSPELAAAVSPPHYSRLSPEPIEVMEAWDLPFHEAQILKYISRAGIKGGPEKHLEDLLKARFYLNRRILCLQQKMVKP